MSFVADITDETGRKNKCYYKLGLLQNIIIRLTTIMTHSDFLWNLKKVTYVE